nr:hypothetical protein [Tanacetum cinerariifolium]
DDKRKLTEIKSVDDLEDRKCRSSLQGKRGNANEKS